MSDYNSDSDSDLDTSNDSERMENNVRQIKNRYRRLSNKSTTNRLARRITFSDQTDVIDESSNNISININDDNNVVDDSRYTFADMYNDSYPGLPVVTSAVNPYHTNRIRPEFIDELAEFDNLINEINSAAIILMNSTSNNTTNNTAPSPSDSVIMYRQLSNLSNLPPLPPVPNTVHNQNNQNNQDMEDIFSNVFIDDADMTRPIMSQQSDRSNYTSAPINSPLITYRRSPKTRRTPDNLSPISSPRSEDRAKSTDNLLRRRSRYFSCDICEFNSVSSGVMTNHYAFVHGIREELTPPVVTTQTTSRIRPRSTTYNISMCRCPTCNQVFYSDFEFRSHICNIDQQNTINIPTDPNGEHICPVCSNRYSSTNLMGEHFILTHNSYEDMGLLDNKDNDVDNLGFPGFDILEHIGMIEPLSNTNVQAMIKDKEMCPVCCYVYKNKQEPYVPRIDSLQSLTLLYKSDSELLLESDTESNTHLSSLSDSELDKSDKSSKRRINNPKLVSKINNIRDKEVIPLKMACCNCYICHDCLKRCVQAGDNVICSFCKRDHTNTNIDYITIVEPVHECDEEKWLPWWYNHAFIFDLE